MNELIRRNTKKLFLTFNKGERDEFIPVAQEYVEREKRKNHHVLAKQMERQYSEPNGSTGAR